MRQFSLTRSQKRGGHGDRDTRSKILPDAGQPHASFTRALLHTSLCTPQQHTSTIASAATSAALHGHPIHLSRSAAHSLQVRTSPGRLSSGRSCFIRPGCPSMRPCHTRQHSPATSSFSWLLLELRTPGARTSYISLGASALSLASRLSSASHQPLAALLPAASIDLVDKKKKQEFELEGADARVQTVCVVPLVVSSASNVRNLSQGGFIAGWGNLWSRDIPLKWSILAWHLVKGCVLTDEVLTGCGIPLCSKCSCCSIPSVESSTHLFFTSDVANDVWNSLFDVLKFQNLTDAISASVLALKDVALDQRRSISHWGIHHPQPFRQSPKNVKWLLPPTGRFKLNVDGALKHSSGVAAGDPIEGYWSSVLGCFHAIFHVLSLRLCRWAAPGLVAIWSSHMVVGPTRVGSDRAALRLTSHRPVLWNLRACPSTRCASGLLPFPKTPVLMGPLRVVSEPRVRPSSVSLDGGENGVGQRGTIVRPDYGLWLCLSMRLTLTGGETWTRGGPLRCSCFLCRTGEGLGSLLGFVREAHPLLYFLPGLSSREPVLVFGWSALCHLWLAVLAMMASSKASKGTMLTPEQFQRLSLAKFSIYPVTGYVKGTKVTVSEELLGCPNFGHKLSEIVPLDKQKMGIIGSLGTVSKKGLLVNELSVEKRLIHSVITNIITPRAGTHSSITAGNGSLLF
ncbi:hypothetical protein Taro_051651 [Colocasia esculenta]|uniref:Reverse transcriptase zinc-binding domain-containing protein n=1 Tax=Colocasia esculenta TaxID=4460 RepID=A0A843XH48_COLES|nr:hypothetical protein [Colocasia esculenta]